MTEGTEASRSPPASRLLGAIRHHPSGAFGLGVVVLVVAAAVMADVLATTSPTLLDPVNAFAPPSDRHWLGTDEVGRDVFSRVLHGLRVSLLVGVVVAIVSTIIGLALGAVAGFVRGLDSIVMRVMDGLMSIPAILLAIALTSTLGAGIVTVVIAIVVVEVPRVVRLVRSVVLQLRGQPFIEAAIVSGASFTRILTIHIFPNTIAPLTVQATFICASAIIIESALSFLGAGVPPGIPSWGNIMATSKGYFLIAPWLVLLPGICVTVLVLAVNLLGDSLRDAVDPRMRNTLDA